MTAAICAAEREKSILLLEKADRPGRKILASGNGRCNLMNSGKPRYYGDAEFARRVLSACTPEDLKSFFCRYGLLVSEEGEGRIYPVTGQASSVVSVLKNAMEMLGVRSVTGKQAVSVAKEKDAFTIYTSSGETYCSDRIIIACGGAASPKLGGTYDGYRLLQSMGHTFIPAFPSLVPLNTDKKSVSGLSGIRIRCGVTLKHREETIHTEEGEVLFTDYGVSGICIMQCARFTGQTGTYIELDLIRHVFSDQEAAFRELLRRKTFFQACSPIWLLNGVLPEKVSFAVLKQAGLPMRGEKAGEISEEALHRIAETAAKYRIDITGTRGFDQAQVTAGGIDCGEFSPFSLESVIVPGLFAAGEVLNVDGDCGGFNLMFAFASGITAGRAV